MQKLKSQNYLNKNDQFSNYAWNVLSEVLYYVLFIADEIAPDIIAIDDAMKNGFGWKFGPFEIIDKIGSSFLKEKFINSKKNIPNLGFKAGKCLQITQITD